MNDLEWSMFSYYVIYLLWKAQKNHAEKREESFKFLNCVVNEYNPTTFLVHNKIPHPSSFATPYSWPTSDILDFKVIHLKLYDSKEPIIID